jgi:hypothetical protein
MKKKTESKPKAAASSTKTEAKSAAGAKKGGKK